MDTSEFLVALAASVGFLIGLGTEVLDPWTIGWLLLGGVLAAWLVTKIPAPVLGAAVGGIIVFTNTRTILRALDVTDRAANTIYAFIVGIWVAAVAMAIARVRRGALPREAVDETAADEPAETTSAPDPAARSLQRSHHHAVPLHRGGFAATGPEPADVRTFAGPSRCADTRLSHVRSRRNIDACPPPPPRPPRAGVPDRTCG